MECAFDFFLVRNKLGALAVRFPDILFQVFAHFPEMRNLALIIDYRAFV